MSDTDPRAGAGPEDDPEAKSGTGARSAASVIQSGLGDRRDSARAPVQEPCTVFIGSHVHDGILRDVSSGGAMVHGVRGLLEGDWVRLRVARLADRAFVAQVRGVSLLGVHVAIQGGPDLGRWRDAIRDLLPDATQGPG